MTWLGSWSRAEGVIELVSISHSTSKHPCLVRLPAIAARHPGLQPGSDWHGVQRCRTAEHPWLPWALLSKCQRLSVEGHLSYGWWLPGTQSVLSLIDNLSHYIEPGCAHRVRKEWREICSRRRLRGSPRPRPSSSSWLFVRRNLRKRQ